MRLLVPLSLVTLLLVAAACGAADDAPARDSAGAPPADEDSASAAGAQGARVEPMPTTGGDSAAKIPTARGAGGTEKMPNATSGTPPAPRPPTTKRPPTRVVPDPVVPPRDSGTPGRP